MLYQVDSLSIHLSIEVDVEHLECVSYNKRSDLSLQQYIAYAILTLVSNTWLVVPPSNQHRGHSAMCSSVLLARSSRLRKDSAMLILIAYW